MEDMIRAEKLTFNYEQSDDGIKDIDFSVKDLPETAAAVSLLF